MRSNASPSRRTKASSRRRWRVSSLFFASIASLPRLERSQTRILHPELLFLSLRRIGPRPALGHCARQIEWPVFESVLERQLDLRRAKPRLGRAAVRGGGPATQGFGHALAQQAARALQLA